MLLLQGMLSSDDLQDPAINHTQDARKKMVPRMSLSRDSQGRIAKNEKAAIVVNSSDLVLLAQSKGIGENLGLL